MRFLPSLRRASLPAAQREEKVLLSDYYAGLTALGVQSPDLAREWNVDRAVQDAYEVVVWVNKAVEAIASSQSRLPFRLREGEHVLDDHPLYRVLNRRANPLETGQQFRHRLSQQILLSKRGAFVEVTESRAGTPVRLDLLPPGRTRPVPGTGAELLSHFEIRDVNGVKTREVDPERVRWFRVPHPLDPFSGVTPLEAAGLSIELDHHARAYNVRFLRNDGRPGTLVVVKGDADDPVLRGIEAKLDRGPSAAGRTTVITGDGLEFVDLAGKPRDMAYAALAKNARQEITIAFGVPESVMGNASERTFANAEAEQYIYWSVTMPPHLDLVATGFDMDCDDDLEPFLDTSTVEVLQRAAKERRQEAREEVTAGLRSIWDYAQLAGIDEIEDTPKTRALWMAAGKTPLPSRVADDDSDDHAAEQQTDSNAALLQEIIASATAAAAPEEEDTSEPSPPRQAAEDADTDAAGKEPAAAGAKVLHLVTSKAAPTPELAAGPAAGFSPDREARDRLQTALEAALAALAARWAERAAVKLGSPKARKGTRHWTPQPGLPLDGRVGVKALDTSAAADPERWAAEAQDTARPLVEQAAIAAAAAAALQLAVDDPEDEDTAGQVALVVVATLALIGRGAARQAELLAGHVTGLDDTGARLVDIQAAVRDDAARRFQAWAARAATVAATGATEGAVYATVESLTARGLLPRVIRVWNTQDDERVRPTHGDADGQQQRMPNPFEVGRALLRFPGDPLGPPEETVNCRCYLTYNPADAGWKARHVRTAAGAARYHQPIGSEITAKPDADRPAGRAGRAAGSVLTGRGRPDGAGTAADPIDVEGDIDKALQLLGEGKHVRLNRPQEAATLIKKLHDAVADLKTQGRTAPTFDLCKVSVPGTNLFCAKHKGVPRAKMPQVAGRPRPGSPAAGIAARRGTAPNGKVDLTPEFREALAAAGVGVKQQTIRASRLHASQMELDGATVSAIPEAIRTGAIPSDARIAVTRDGYILDGHHRWAAQVYQDIEDDHLGDVSIKADVLDMDIGAAIAFANAFATRMGIAAETVGPATTTRAETKAGLSDASAGSATPNRAALPGPRHDAITGVVPGGDATAAVDALDPEHTTAAAGPLTDERVDWPLLAELVSDVDDWDAALSEIQAAQGFDGPPMAVPGDGLAALVDSGWRRLYRGLAAADAEQLAAWVEEWQAGQLFPGLGVAGNGTWTTEDPADAARYAAAPGGAVLELALSPDATVVPYTDAVDGARAERDQLTAERHRLGSALPTLVARAATVDERERLLDQHRSRQEWISAKLAVLADPGRYAAACGYDAVDLDGQYLVLNRTATAVRTA